MGPDQVIFEDEDDDDEHDWEARLAAFGPESNTVLPRANTETSDKRPAKNFPASEAAVTRDFFEV